MQILNSSVRHTNKQNGHSSPNKELQRVRIQLNDRIFQFHKLQEDTAQEKAKMFIEFQKERGHLTKTIKELRQKNVGDNEEWTKKIDQLRKENEQTISLLIQKYQMKMQRDKNQLKQQIQSTVKTQFQVLRNKAASQRLELQSKIKKCELQKQSTIHFLTNSAKKKQHQKEKQYTIFIEGLKKQNELKVNQLKTLYLRQEQQRKRLTKELEQKFKDYVKQKIIHQGINNQLTSQIEKLSKQIEGLKLNLESQISKSIELCQKHKKELQEAEVRYKNQLVRIQNEGQLKSKRTFAIFDQEIQKLGVEIATLQHIHKQKQLLWEERGKKILLQYEKRESKKEDLKAIESLQVELIKRDFLLERQKKQLKHCKLQLQNMQQIYDKMFLSNNYLAKVKAKSFKVKKLKTSILMNSSNRSTIMQNKKGTLDQR